MKLLNSEYPTPLPTSSYRIDGSRRTRFEEYHGKVRLEDLRSVVSAAASDPCWCPEQHVLADFTDAELELSYNDVLRMALTLRHEGSRSHGWMIFVVNNPVSYGVIRMLGYWSRNTDRFRIFPSIEEADRWLDRHQYEFPPAFRDMEAKPRPQMELREVG